MRYSIGYSSYGGFELVSHVDTLKEAEAWLLAAPDLDGSMAVYGCHNEENNG